MMPFFYVCHICAIKKGRVSPNFGLLEVIMRRFMIIFSIIIGISLLFGPDGFSVWTHILALLIMLIGVLYMFTGRILPQFVETLLIVLVVPLFVIYLYSFTAQFIRSLSLNPQIDVSPWPILIIVFLLMFCASLYILHIRRQNQRLNRPRTPGSEREPVIPNYPTQNDQIRD